ncbi:MAG: LysM peptidoglycan-binding domain-containing protein [Candidatus Melainabacteria bacterium]|nr:LysM peptidoglycan-binding domain-containing protein [Candidatus Melainabacteria bacterium]
MSTNTMSNDIQDDILAVAEEKSPGVYVRTDGHSPRELDMLWSGSRPYQREDRAPIFYFVTGLLVGGVLTAAVLLLFVVQPKLPTLGVDNQLIRSVEDVATGIGNQVTESAVNTPTSAGNAATGAVPLTNADGQVIPNAKSYTVQSGDTLGSIAAQFYGSSGPEFVDKIQRANNLRNAHSIRVEQRLVIPPKNY